MVLQRRLDYGFNGYQVPAMPRGSRSARGKVLFKKKAENKQMCAFDLLATVAGELLQEKDTSPNHSNQSVGQVDLLTRKDIVKKEEQDRDKLFKPGPYDQGSCDESVYAFPEKLQQHAQNGNLKHYCHAHGDTSLKPSSRITKFDRFEEVAYPEESTGKGRNGFGTSPIVSHANSSVQRGLPDFAESYNCKVEEELERQLQPQDGRIGSRGLPDMCNSEDPIDTKPPALVSSDSSVEVPLSGDRISQGVFFNRCQNDIKIVSRDDDENSSGCTQPRSTTMKTLRPPRIGDRRMRKLLASKCWKVAPVSLKHGNLSYYDMEMKPAFRSRKMCYTRQRTQRGATFKRRKLYGRYSMLISDGRNSSGVSSSANKGMNGATTASCVTIHGATSGSSSLLSGQKSSFASGDSHVKLSIKSFKIPELFIDIPETDTVGSLKRAVLEAVTAILDGGLRVGVLHQGKKVRDDKKTLLQTGISHDDKLDSLGFILEPSTPLPPPLYTEDTHIHALHKAPQQQTMCPTVPALDQGVADPSPDLAQITTGHFTESDHDLALPSSDIPLDNASSNSRALVAVSPMTVEALSVVPLHRKSRRSDFVQRRIRRPFSVSEVEALVQAVERLGTGRWRDVKLHAFENATHRTYVDLKDKWKTLVHTARISPQQRRGEPVPQELLDRVLSAHAYWFKQQQIKQEGDTCLPF